MMDKVSRKDVPINISPVTNVEKINMDILPMIQKKYIGIIIY